jgi:hypothetical protein
MTEGIEFSSFIREKEYRIVEGIAGRFVLITIPLMTSGDETRADLQVPLKIIQSKGLRAHTLVLRSAHYGTCYKMIIDSNGNQTLGLIEQSES